MQKVSQCYANLMQMWCKYYAVLCKCNMNVILMLWGSYANVMYKNTVQMLYANALCKYSVQMLYANALWKCSMQMLYANALCKCYGYANAMAMQMLWLCKCYGYANAMAVVNATAMQLLWLFKCYGYANPIWILYECFMNATWIISSCCCILRFGDEVTFSSFAYHCRVFGHFAAFETYLVTVMYIVSNKYWYQGIPFCEWINPTAKFSLHVIKLYIILRIELAFAIQWWPEHLAVAVDWFAVVLWVPSSGLG